MSDDRAPVRSYARIFRPERRIYSVEGHPLPVPGGVPLAWLAWAVGTLVTVIALSGGSWPVAAVIGAAVGGAGLAVGGRAAAAIAGAATLGACQIAGVVLGALDWPLRLVIVPALVATLATQATPDGRPAHRYALSWLALQIRPPRRSLGRELPAAGARRCHAAELWAVPDARGEAFPRGRVRGPAILWFRAPVVVHEGRGLRGRRLAARPARPDAQGAVERVELAAVERVELAAGERVELRP